MIKNSILKLLDRVETQVQKWTFIYDNTNAIGNCKLLGQIIKQHQAQATFKHFRAQLNQFVEFWSTTQKGIFCSICDPENQLNFDLPNRYFNISKNFCYTLIVKSLPVLMYLHIYLNDLITSLVSANEWCDTYLNFSYKELPDSLVLQRSEKIKEVLIHCSSSLQNQSTYWLEYCS